MLKARILTAIFLLPMTLFILFFAPFPVFLFTTSLVTLIGAWEFSRLMKITSLIRRIIFVLTIILMGVLASNLPVFLILKMATVFWCAIVLLVVSYPRTAKYWSKSILCQSVMGIMVLIPFWVALNSMRVQTDGALILLYVLLIIWSADTGAYFAGRRFGRNPLAPLVSPGKTIEGVFGGMILALLVTVVALLLTRTPFVIGWKYMILTIIVTLFSVIGDLFESVMKREAGVKDSGRLLPGHGGFLDRIDSLTAALPIFLFGITMLGKLSH